VGRTRENWLIGWSMTNYSSGRCEVLLCILSNQCILAVILSGVWQDRVQMTLVTSQDILIARKICNLVGRPAEWHNKY